MHILLKAKTTRDIVGSASVDHLLYLGYIVIDYFWQNGSNCLWKLALRTCESIYEYMMI